MKTGAFLLFEVLVAILIATTALVIIMQGMGSALRAGNVVGGYYKARILADSMLAMLEREVAWKTETSSGRFTKEQDPEGSFTWEQEIARVVTPMWGTETLPVNEARVTVRWKGNKIELVTYVTEDVETRPER